MKACRLPETIMYTSTEASLLHAFLLLYIDSSRDGAPRMMWVGCAICTTNTTSIYVYSDVSPILFLINVLRFAA